MNGQHFLDFELNANVESVALQLSATDLDFSLDLSDWQPHADRKLEVQNPNSFAAAFELENPAPGLFDIEPLRGQIAAKEKQLIALRWTPSAQALSSGTRPCLCIADHHTTAAPRSVWPMTKLLLFRSHALAGSS